MQPDIIRVIREQYVEAFRKGATQLKAAHDCEIGIEPILRNEDGSIPFVEPLSLPARQDAAIFKNGVPTTALVINARAVDPFSPVGWKCGSEQVNLLVGPFSWDNCNFEVIFDNHDVAWDPIVDWFMYWVDMDEKTTPDTDGVRETVHAVVGPELHSGMFRFTVDFGTSDVLAFDELVNELLGMGAKYIFVGDCSEVVGEGEAVSVN